MFGQREQSICGLQICSTASIKSATVAVSSSWSQLNWPASVKNTFMLYSPLSQAKSFVALFIWNLPIMRLHICIEKKIKIGPVCSDSLAVLIYASTLNLAVHRHNNGNRLRPPRWSTEYCRWPFVYRRSFDYRRSVLLTGSIQVIAIHGLSHGFPRLRCY